VWHHKHIPHCPIVCSTCCGTKVAQIDIYEHNWKIGEKKVEGEQLSILSGIRNEIQENWDNTYMNAKYNPGKVFQGVLVNKKKTRKIKHEYFPKLPHVQQLIKIFENLHNDMRVTEVWFLKKKDKCDGFVDFH
jgi:hypothetical protein